MAVKKSKKIKAKVKKTGPKSSPKKSPAKSSAKKSSPAKKTAAKKTTGKRGGFHRELNPDTGFVVGTESQRIAEALIEGGESRAEIVARLEKELPKETRDGTPKQVTNMVSGVLNKMLARGYTIEQSFALAEPTPASKRAATRAANKKSAAPAKKTPAKKTAAKGKKGAAAKKRK